MSEIITQEMRDANEFAHFKAFAIAQQERYRLIHEARVAGSPWLQQVREAQKKLNESEAN